MKLSEFLGAAFSHDGRIFPKAARLHRAIVNLKDAFGQFGGHIANVREDPEFFCQGLKVDIAAMDKGLITLTAFGMNQIRFCFDAIQDKLEVRGTVTCYLIRGHDVAQGGIEAGRHRLGSWEFKEDGETNIKLGDDGLLSMTAPKEAVALAAVVVLAAFSADEVKDP
jgi:hypothetical protein